jgi:hypothetical protein
MNFKTIAPIQSREEKSHRDETLLTGGFNLRTNASHSPISPVGTTLRSRKVPSLRDLVRYIMSPLRRLRFASPTVNKVSSLRDISSQLRHYYKLFICMSKEKRNSFIKTLGINKI